jgi:general secretion pathway protein F
MPEYFYKAIAPDGKLLEGSLTRDTERMVAKELTIGGLTPVYVGVQRQKGGGSLSFDLAALLRRRPGAADRLYFTQELATLLEAGLPLDRALSIAAELSERPAFRTVIQEILRELKGGKSLTDALGTHPEIFSELYRNMVRAGEASGSLSQVMLRLSESEQASGELRGFLISSMIYPSLLALVGLGSVTLMLGYVIPKFSEVFKESGLPIPAPTQMLLTISELTQQYGLWALGAVIAAFIGFRYWVSTREGRLRWDTFKLTAPAIGGIISRAETARFARSMSTLVGNGVPLVQSLRIGKSMLGNTVMANAVDEVAQGVKRGEGLAGPLRRTGAFPSLAAHLLQVGEETGRLDSMFTRMADIYDAETRTTVRRATALFEPIVILTMGSIVGTMVLSMMLAIVSMNDVPFTK